MTEISSDTHCKSKFFGSDTDSAITDLTTIYSRATLDTTDADSLAGTVPRQVPQCVCAQHKAANATGTDNLGGKLRSVKDGVVKCSKRLRRLNPQMYHDYIRLAQGDEDTAAHKSIYSYYNAYDERRTASKARPAAPTARRGPAVVDAAAVRSYWLDETPLTDLEFEDSTDEE
ncbi:Spl2p KNAG_0H03720 [Huiozyma naganishii CBS 8797]|uniref:Uncharacterized protein n=1 Tax=Huiozyma naganishii (strain ATCC MYA-139 / BCRC 22969 / CBS 8797 / KCTC 17520 / NBRC 10181 / NCYC 3082 / Yp74L-3) TaxID=1071383 RepID=J7S9Y0_HUIN7|nr:hypothetical protein KNAG_0H03720 [Kazachstania naganishii CBS 8797]CCK71786.1 hypothetical protein KNAG_0H03720 [Kazachstania naganishii CBS 8797]